MNDLLLPAVQKSTGPDTDPYYNLVSLHLKGDVNTGRNYNAFSDASSNNFRLTNNGDVRGSSFSPYGTSWSGFFDGSGDYLSAPYTTPLNLGTSDFTIEAWINTNSLSGSRGIVGIGNADPSSGIILRINNNTVQFWVNGYNTGVTGSSTILGGVWYHVALVRSGSTNTLYLNGVSIGSNSTTPSIGSPATAVIGRTYANSADEYFSGYISNVRIVKGVAVYTGSFNPPTAPLTATQSAGTNIAAITGTATSLIACHANRFIDRDGAAGTYSITVFDGARISSFSPFLELDTTTGSGYFDGTGDFLSLPLQTPLLLGNSDWSFDCWVYTTNFLASRQALMNGQTDAATAGGSSWFFAIANTSIINDVWVGGSNVGVTCPTPSLNSWHHIAYARTGGTMSSYLNGVRVGTRSDLGTSSIQNGATNYPPVIGSANGGTNLMFTGNISDLRLIKGSGGYDATQANITVPTAPRTSTANTSVLTLQERGAYNTIGFQDESEYQHIITRNGNVAQGTFSPFSNAGWSGYFDGTGDYLTVASNSAFAFGTNDFAVAFWIYPTQAFLATGSAPVSMAYNTGFNISIDNVELSFWIAGTRIQSSTRPTPNQWNYVVCTRQSGTAYVYINGNQTATGSLTGSVTNSQIYIGTASHNVAAETVVGYLSDVQILGSYLAATVPTSKATSGANTKLLACHTNRFIDGSSSPKTITVNDGARVVPFSPFKPVAYDPAVHGGSGYWDGTTDWLSIADNAAFTLGNSDFCIELWINSSASMGGYAGFFGQWANATTNCSFIFRTQASQIVQFGYTTSGNAQAGTTVDGSALTANSWNHLVVCRSGANLAIFQNGTRTATHNISTLTIADSTRDMQIGYSTDGGYVLGYMSSLRVVKGSAVYDPTQTTITVPSGPLPILPNTSLLLNFTNGGVIDSTGKNVLETFGNAGVVTTTIKKYGSGSMFFDGTGDYEICNSSAANAAFGTGNWTIEFWLYLNTTSGTQLICDYRKSTSSDLAPMLMYYANAVCFYTNANVQITGSALTAGTWNHIALCKSSGSTKLYINGVQSGSTYTDSLNYVGFADRPVLGAEGVSVGSNPLNGYIDDFRATKGTARYTANFTPPTKALPDRGTASTLTTDMAAPSSVEALVVAGGASGGGSISGGYSGSGGGGAGGFREFVGGNAISVAANTNYQLTIGAGGTGASASRGGSGNQSVFGSITSVGGGGGGASNGVAGAIAGLNGGSGGGAGGWTGGAGGKGVYPGSTYLDATRQGYDGGTSSSINNGGASGGGGAGSAGNSYVSGEGGVLGGAGASSSITGVPVTYAGGGSAGSYGSGAQAASPGGGGGAGGTPNVAGVAGTPNTGGGGGGGGGSSVGGGSSTTGGTGGSGVIIIAYPTSFRPLKASLGLVYTIDTVTRPGYRVYRFTAGTGNISW